MLFDLVPETSARCRYDMQRHSERVHFKAQSFRLESFSLLEVASRRTTGQGHTRGEPVLVTN